MYNIEYVIQDDSKKHEDCIRTTEVLATQAEVQQLIEKGYLLIDNIFDSKKIENLDVYKRRVIYAQIEISRI